MSNRRKTRTRRPMPTRPADDAPEEAWTGYLNDAASVLAANATPELTEYVRMVRKHTEGYQWSVSPWRAWRMAEGSAEQQELVSLMLFSKHCGQTCLAEIASMTQVHVREVVSNLEEMEALGYIRWDNDGQQIVLIIPGEGEVPPCDGSCPGGH